MAVVSLLQGDVEWTQLCVAVCSIACQGLPVLLQLHGVEPLLSQQIAGQVRFRKLEHRNRQQCDCR